MNPPLQGTENLKQVPESSCDVYNPLVPLLSCHWLPFIRNRPFLQAIVIARSTLLFVAHPSIKQHDTVATKQRRASEFKKQSAWHCELFPSFRYRYTNIYGSSPGKYLYVMIWCKSILRSVPVWRAAIPRSLQAFGSAEGKSSTTIQPILTSIY